MPLNVHNADTGEYLGTADPDSPLEKAYNEVKSIGGNLGRVVVNGNLPVMLIDGPDIAAQMAEEKAKAAALAAKGIKPITVEQAFTPVGTVEVKPLPDIAEITPGAMAEADSPSEPPGWFKTWLANVEADVKGQHSAAPIEETGEPTA